MHVNCMCITKVGMCIVMHVNCMCITKVGMHCYACKLHVYNKGGYALLCM